MDLQKYKDCFAHKNAIYISNEDEPSRPCCWYKHNVKADTWQEYHEKISQTDIETGCAHCIEAEENGSEWSHRTQYENDFYVNHGKVFLLGICFDNLCNIKCTTCGPLHSSKWIEDFTKLGRWSEYNNKTKYLKMMTQAPDKVAFAKNIIASNEFDVLKLDMFGGEPTINPTVQEFLEWLANSEYASKVALALTTNATKMLPNFEKYLSVFKNISVQCSIDGIEDHYEYLRYGGHWIEVEQNMKKYYEFAVKHKKFRFGIHYTLSWMNSLHFKDFCAWLVKTFPHYDSIGLYLTKLVGPAEYSVDIMSVESKEKILDINVDFITKLTHPLKLKNTTARSKIVNFKTNIDVILLKFIDLYKSSLINYVTPEDKLILYKTMLAHRALTQLDGIRNTDYTKTFKDVLPYLENLNEQTT